MPRIKVEIAPGFNSQRTQIQAAGGWFTGNLLRWKTGLLEKIAGWQRLVPEQCAGLIRELHAWADLNSNHNLLIGTDAGPQLLINDEMHTVAEAGISLTFGDLPTDVRFTVAVGNTTVQVTSNALVGVGDKFTLQMPVSIGGQILPKGSSYEVTARTSTPVGFTFEMPVMAIYSEGPVPGIAQIIDDLGPPGADPQLHVVFNRHGLSTGNSFTFDQATFYWELDLTKPRGVAWNIPAGSTVTVTVLSSDAFKFSAAGYGNPIDGGGSPPVLPYASVYMGQHVQDAAPYGLDTKTSSTGMTLARPQVVGNPQSTTWFADNLGENGLILSSGGPLTVYTPPFVSDDCLTTVGRGTGAMLAPQRNNGMFVAMPQAQVILFGTEPIMGGTVFDPLLVRFSDAGTFDVYTATVSNMAGSYRLSRGSKIVGGIQAPQTTLLFTDLDCWAMSFIGPPLVYGFTVMGTNCGLVAPHAVATLGRTTIWASLDSFWQFGDGGVQQLQCPIWDEVFNDLDQTNIKKCVMGTNSSGDEFIFFYPSGEHAASIQLPTNLLWWSSDLMQTTKWVQQNITISNVGGTTPAPDGTNTAQELIEDTSAGEHRVAQTVEKERTRKNYTFSVYAHPVPGTAGPRELALQVRSGDPSVLIQQFIASSESSAHAVFDIEHGTIEGSATTGGSGKFTIHFRSIVTDSLATGSSGNGWYRCIFQFTSDSEPRVHAILMPAAGPALSYQGGGLPRGGVILWGVMLNEGWTLPPPPYEPTEEEIQNEPTRYVKYNPIERAWDSGELMRTAWLDQNVFGQPLAGDVNKRIQQHEIGYDDDDQPMRGVFAETGYSSMGDGTVQYMIDHCEPDFKWFGHNGAVDLTFKSLSFPGSDAIHYGPFSMTEKTQFFTPRVRGRYVAIRYDWAPLSGFSARVGATAFRLKPAGRRP